MSVLGAQTATLIPQVRGRHNEYSDGPRTTYEGCLLELLGEPTESVNREQRTEVRWRLFAPPGFRAAAADHVEVVPGPLTDDGVSPARLNLVGPAYPRVGFDGLEDHVVVVLRRRTG